MFALLSKPEVLNACDDIALFHNMRGMAARKIPGHDSIAIEAYQKSLLLEPDRPDTLYNLANLLRDDEPDKAIPLYAKSLNRQPHSATCWHNYAAALLALDQHQQCFQPLHLSLQLDPVVADVWCNLGLTYFGLERFVEAERCFRHAISLDTRHAASYSNLGNTLFINFQPEEALEFLEKGVSLDSSSSNSLWNLALGYLLLGRYREGWSYYEARFSCKDFKLVHPPTRGPRLKSIDLASRDISHPLVVWSEQGLGDSIQFVRYLDLLRASGIPFVFRTRKILSRLFRQWCDWGECVIDDSDKLHESLLENPHIPLMSLPLLFDTEIDTIPSQLPYLRPPTSPPHSLRLDTPPGGIALGLVWASNPDNKAMYANKSIPLELLMPRLIKLLRLDLVHLHALQFGSDASQIQPWLDLEGVFDWHQQLNDFSDTAFIVNQLDLVITVDTAVAHLAGALNKPTWLLLPHNPDFRWLRDRSDSPWYSSMRIFRQSSRGDWQSVVRDVYDAMDQLFALNVEDVAAAEAL